MLLGISQTYNLFVSPQIDDVYTGGYGIFAEAFLDLTGRRVVNSSDVDDIRVVKVTLLAELSIGISVSTLYQFRISFMLLFCTIRTTSFR